MKLGCGEAGLDGKKFDTKVIVESSLKTPKSMHAMFVRLCGSVENKQEAIKKLEVFGLVSEKITCHEYKNTWTNSHCVSLGFKMRMLIMDCPNGYNCRLRGTTAAVFNGKEETLRSGFCKTYQLIWKAKVKIPLYFIHWVDN